jgi:hypothetical protein
VHLRRGGSTSENRHEDSGTGPQTLPLFYQKDATHQLYQLFGVAKFAHYGLAGSQLYVNMFENTTAMPTAGWKLAGGLAPAPAALTCADN